MIWFTVLHTYQSSNLAQLGEEHGIHLVGDDQISLRKVREFCKTVGASVSIRRSPYKIFIGTNAKVERVLKRHVYADRDLEANCLFAGLPPVYSYFFSLPSGGFLFEPSEVGALRAWLGDQSVPPFWQTSKLFTRYVRKFGEPERYAVSVRRFPSASGSSKKAVDLFILFHGYRNDEGLRAIRFQRLDPKVIVESEVVEFPRPYTGAMDRT